MPLETTLARIETDIANGDLGKVRDRLHGLLLNYPNNFDLRKRLGDIYWQLQYGLEMAGKFWYLEEVKDEKMQKACEKFEKQHGKDEASILRALKYRGNFEEIKDSFPGRAMLQLHQKAQAKNRGYKDFRLNARNLSKHPHVKAPPNLFTKLRNLGFSIFMTLIVLLLIASLIIGAKDLLSYMIKGLMHLIESA